MASNIETSPNRYRFTGKERDEENGFDYHGARYFSLSLTRWISCDVVEYPDRYIYVFNNPIIFRDPSGNDAELPPQNRFDFIHKRNSFEDFLDAASQQQSNQMDPLPSAGPDPTSSDSSARYHKGTLRMGQPLEFFERELRPINSGARLKQQAADAKSGLVKEMFRTEFGGGGTFGIVTNTELGPDWARSSIATQTFYGSATFDLRHVDVNGAVIRGKGQVKFPGVKLSHTSEFMSGKAAGGFLDPSTGAVGLNFDIKLTLIRTDFKVSLNPEGTGSSFDLFMAKAGGALNLGGRLKSSIGIRDKDRDGRIEICRGIAVEAGVGGKLKGCFETPLFLPGLSKILNQVPDTGARGEADN